MNTKRFIIQIILTGGDITHKGQVATNANEALDKVYYRLAGTSNGLYPEDRTKYSIVTKPLVR